MIPMMKPGVLVNGLERNWEKTNKFLENVRLNNNLRAYHAIYS
jgi:hypothetical protein